MARPRGSWLLGVVMFAALAAGAAPAWGACCACTCFTAPLAGTFTACFPTDVCDASQCPPECPPGASGPGTLTSATSDCDSRGFERCPTSEAEVPGGCRDGVNNDAWLDAVTDCAEPDCRAECVAAPVASRHGLLVLAVLLLALAVAALGLRRRSRGAA